MPCTATHADECSVAHGGPVGVFSTAIYTLAVARKALDDFQTSHRQWLERYCQPGHGFHGFVVAASVGLVSMVSHSLQSRGGKMNEIVHVVVDAVVFVAADSIPLGHADKDSVCVVMTTTSTTTNSVRRRMVVVVVIVK